LEHGLSNFLEWGTMPRQYGIVPVTLALALLINFFCLNLEKSTHYLSIYLQRIKKPKGRHMKRSGDRGGPLIKNGRTKWTNKWRLDIKIKVCFCPQKRNKSIGSGCFFPDLDPSVNLIGHAAITEMIKLQFTTITDRIRNKIRNGNSISSISNSIDHLLIIFTGITVFFRDAANRRPCRT
jgi:hypothetical protein